MKLLNELTHLTDFPAFNAAAGGGATERIAVPLHHAEVQLPESDLDAVFITGDLQFYDRKTLPEEDRRLMGYVVAEEISALCEVGMLPPADRIGIVLVGDLYAEPCLLKRGGSGDVDDIWCEFSDRFRWVVGVAGNHDLFEGEAEFPSRFSSCSNIHALDFDSVTLDGIRFVGISGIIGNPNKIWRYVDEQMWKGLPKLLSQPTDCLVLHQGPIGSEKGMRGAGLINESIRNSPNKPSLVTFGHCHWPNPFCESESSQYLNSDARAILLTRPGIDVLI